MIDPAIAGIGNIGAQGGRVPLVEVDRPTCSPNAPGRLVFRGEEPDARSGDASRRVIPAERADIQRRVIADRDARRSGVIWVAWVGPPGHEGAPVGHGDGAGSFNFPVVNKITPDRQGGLVAPKRSCSGHQRRVVRSIDAHLGSEALHLSPVGDHQAVATSLVSHGEIAIGQVEGRSGSGHQQRVVRGAAAVAHQDLDSFGDGSVGDHHAVAASPSSHRDEAGPVAVQGIAPTHREGVVGVALVVADPGAPHSAQGGGGGTAINHQGVAAPMVADVGTRVVVDPRVDDHRLAGAVAADIEVLDTEHIECIVTHADRRGVKIATGVHGGEVVGRVAVARPPGHHLHRSASQIVRAELDAKHLPIIVLALCDREGSGNIQECPGGKFWERDARSAVGDE